VQYNVKLGFVPNMNVPGTFYVNDKLKDLLFEELAQSVQRGEVNTALSTGQGSAAQHSMQRWSPQTQHSSRLCTAPGGCFARMQQ